MLAKKKTKKVIGEKKAVVVRDITYRLALTDSENRSVQIDLAGPIAELEELDVLNLKYNDLLEDERKVKDLLEANDIKVAKDLQTIHEEKQDALSKRECDTCGGKWLGGEERCPRNGCEGTSTI